MKYRYLLWDIDGTVLDFLAAEKAAIRALFLKFGYGICTDEMISRYSRINAGYWQRLERNEMTKAEILVKRFEDFFRLEGIDVEEAAAFNAEYQVELGNTVVFHDGSDEILKKLKGNYVQVAITNGTKVAQNKKLTNSGLYDILDYTFISEDVGAEKPNLEFFNRVIEEIGIENLSHALIIGDSLTSDILGGINAGIDTCWYNPGHQKNDKNYLPTYEIDNLNRIWELIAD